MKILNTVGSILALLTITYLTNATVHAENRIYQWVDNRGKTHFGDQLEYSQAIKIFNVQEFNKPTISVVQWKTAKANFNLPKRPATKRRYGTKSNCSEIDQKIVKLEKKLKQKSKAEEFDRFNSELDSLRWHKIKQC